MRTEKKQRLAQLRRWRIRQKINGTKERPRMSVCFTNEHIYVLMQGPSEMGASGRLEKWDRFADLKRIAVPTLVISGKHDTMDPAYMARMVKELPKGELLATNGGHLAMYDDQQTYFAGLTKFLRKFK